MSVNTNTAAVTWPWSLPLHITSWQSRSLQGVSWRISDLLANKECCTGRTSLTNLKMRDPAHALRIAVKHKLHRDYVCCEVWNEVFNKRHALVPDKMAAPSAASTKTRASNPLLESAIGGCFEASSICEAAFQFCSGSCREGRTRVIAHRDVARDVIRGSAPHT